MKLFGVLICTLTMSLHHVGLIADVDSNTTINRVTFNGQEMAKRGGSRNEYVYDIRHDKQRNLEATLEVHATVNKQSKAASLNAKVATSSQPFTSADTSGIIAVQSVQLFQLVGQVSIEVREVRTVQQIKTYSFDFSFFCRSI